MSLANWSLTADYQEFVICPCCRASDYEDRYIDPRLLREVEREASDLVRKKRIKQAVEILSALYARYIVALVRPRYRCRRCQATFDA